MNVHPSHEFKSPGEPCRWCCSRKPETLALPCAENSEQDETSIGRCITALDALGYTGQTIDVDDSGHSRAVVVTVYKPGERVEDALSITEPSIKEAFETALRYAREDAAQQSQAVIDTAFEEWASANDHLAGDTHPAFVAGWKAALAHRDEPKPDLSARASILAHGKPNFRGGPSFGGRYKLFSGNKPLDYSFDSELAGWAWLKDTHGIEKPA
jgi:hypothetical protein